MKGKQKVLVVVIVVVLALLVLFTALVGFISDYLWFKELGYTSVFFKQLFTQLKIGIPAFIILTALGFIYLRGVKRGYLKRTKLASDQVNHKSLNRLSVLLSVIAGFALTYISVTRLWFEALKFSNSTSFNLQDPIFNQDISFYVFKLQFIKDLNEIIIIGIVVFAILSFIYYFLLLSMAPPKKYDIPPQQDEGFEDFGETKAKSPFEDILKRFGINTGGAGGFQQQQRPAAARGTFDFKELLHIASKQVTIIGILFFLMVGVNFFLRQFDLLYTESNVLYGAGFTDINVTLWMYRIIMVLSVLAAIMFAVGMSKKKFKTILAVPVLMIAVGILGTGASYIVQQLVVTPDELSKESEYLEYNMNYTRNAYDLQNVEVKSFAAAEDLSKEDIVANMGTIKNIRINDYDPAQKFYNQTQAIRQYYNFNNVNVDRYMINGEYTQVFLAAREIDESKIKDTWVNTHLKYTHGYGITLSRVDKITANGQPDMLIKNIPPQSQVEEIDIQNPAIYFGELTNNYVLVGTDEQEFDYPEGDSNVYSNYNGNAGINLNFFNKLVFSVRERSMKLLVSSNINSNSKIIINRNIKDRVKEIMPYLDYSDPYIVTEGGKLYWIVDAYTTSSYYPYSEPYDSQTSKTNYMRNSVKIVIDAYDGDTNYYLVDDSDPVANTMKNIYPKLFKSGDEMPEGLRAHIRYPSTMLSVQAGIYERYHVNDVKVFYQSEDLWQISNEIYGTKEQLMKPQYYIMKLPGEENVEFINSIPYTPKDKRNMTGLLIARNDGEDYGNLILYQFPKSKVVMGPMQIEAQIDQDTTISKEFSLWQQSGAKYSRGNMFVIPIEDSIMYVEPVYLEADNSSLPEVKRVIIYYNGRIAYEATLAEALDSMFGDGTGDLLDSEKPADGGVSEGGDTGETTQPAAPTQTELITMAYEANLAAQQAQQNGDWAKYGEEMAKVQSYLEQLNGGGNNNNTTTE